MKIVVGLSGGVDSSVAAYLLKQQGHEVIGMFMRNWHDTTGTLAGDCPWHDDQMLAEMVAKALDIPFHYIDLSDEYRRRVVDYMFSEYEHGRTPNPDVLCNREIKFDAFLNAALKLGAEYVATGHYCRVEKTTTKTGDICHKLLAGTDPNKDQSYFLCQLSQEQLSRAVFPIGDLLKPKVREIALEAKLPTAKRKDSQGICFVGKVDLPTFLQQKLAAKQGAIVEISKDWSGYEKHRQASESGDLEQIAAPYIYHEYDGIKIGDHRGAHFYTIGQRGGLGVGGRAEGLYVIATDVEKNIVYVGQGQQHPGLLRCGLHITASEMHWIREDLRLTAGEKEPFLVRIRYRQPLQKATLYSTDEGGYVMFDEPQRGITAGQFAAWYKEDGELIGSGVIKA